MPDDLTSAFKALSNPRRLAMVRRLIGKALGCDACSPELCSFNATCCVFSTFVGELDIGKSTVSHHLKELHEAGLIERFRDGRHVYCRINQERLAELRAALDLRASAEAT